MEVVIVVAAAVFVVSGVGMTLVAAGFGRGRTWALWLPSVFGISIVTGTLAFLYLLVSGTH